MRRRLLIAYAFLGGSLAWTLHLMGSYALAEGLCVAERPARLILGFHPVAFIVTGFNVVLLLIACGAAATAFTLLRQARRGRSLLFGSSDSFVALGGLVLDLLFAAFILAGMLPGFLLLRGC